MPTFFWNEPSENYDPSSLPMLDKHGVVLVEGDKIRCDLFPNLVLEVLYDEQLGWVAQKLNGSDPQSIEGLSHRIEVILDNE